MDWTSMSAAARAVRRGTTAGIVAAAAACVLAGCGGDEPARSDPSNTVVAAPPGTPTTAAASEPEAPAQLGATLAWPQGTETFALTVCVSIGKSTIQGAGSSADWKLTFDANLLTPDDTGTLQVSRASDMAVEYDADILTLAVQPDGTFEATGKDAAGAQFRLTGTCTVSW